jgi:hypothetical protein
LWRLQNHVKAFKVPMPSLGDLSAETAAHVIETASDVALGVDGNGVIQDIAVQEAELSEASGSHGKMGSLLE